MRVRSPWARSRASAAAFEVVVAVEGGGQRQPGPLEVDLGPLEVLLGLGPVDLGAEQADLGPGAGLEAHAGVPLPLLGEDDLPLLDRGELLEARHPVVELGHAEEDVPAGLLDGVVDGPLGLESVLDEHDGLGSQDCLVELHLTVGLDHGNDGRLGHGARVDDEVGRVAGDRPASGRPLLRAHVAHPVAGREGEGDLVLVARDLHAGGDLGQVARPGLPGELPRRLDLGVELLDVEVLRPGRVDGLPERQDLLPRRRRRGQWLHRRGGGLGEDEGCEERDWTHETSDLHARSTPERLAALARISRTGSLMQRPGLDSRGPGWRPPRQGTGPPPPPPRGGAAGRAPASPPGPGAWS
jgi:hypothetical protein